MIRRRLTAIRDESGFALVSVLVLMIVGTLFALAAWGTSKADVKPTAADRDSKQAYAAAEAGINWYLFRLGQNNSYWTDCATIPAPNAADPVNLAGATTLRWKTVPGTNSSYAVELMPQNGVAATGSWCVPGDTAQASLLDSASGTLQVRSTGQSNGVRRSVVATLRRSGFLDYLYFTDFETQDPQVTGSGLTCNVYRRNGRSGSCSSIVFASDDAVNGPFHTNDDILTCGTPDFGRTTADQIEVVAPTNGYQSGCGGTPTPNFKGTYVDGSNGAKILTMPASNSTIENVTQTGYLFTGTTKITLKTGGFFDVTNGGVTQTNKAWPTNGVIYVKNGAGAGCQPAHSAPQTYNEPACTGNVYVKGDYNRSITIAAANDVIVNGDVKRSAGSGALAGLIANFFVRVYHPVDTSSGCGNEQNNATYGNYLGSVQIDAAILSVGHSFIVDNYNCGTPRGTLTVNGAIAQTYRGPVGTGGSTISTGYVKNYNYDDRFRVANPPYFLDPVQSSWRKIRFNEETPARQGG
jgi:Tfp pilus assembly protein PilX